MTNKEVKQNLERFPFNTPKNDADEKFAASRYTSGYIDALLDLGLITTQQSFRLKNWKDKKLGWR